MGAWNVVLFILQQRCSRMNTGNKGELVSQQILLTKLYCYECMECCDIQRYSRMNTGNKGKLASINRIMTAGKGPHLTLISAPALADELFVASPDGCLLGLDGSFPACDAPPARTIQTLSSESFSKHISRNSDEIKHTTTTTQTSAIVDISPHSRAAMTTICKKETQDVTHAQNKAIQASILQNQ